MNAIDVWRWRIRWGGRWTITPHHWTEAEIRREHPEAVRIEASRSARPAPVADPSPNRKPAEDMDPMIAPAWAARRYPPKV